MLNDSAPRVPSTCLNRGGANPTPHGVFARLSIVKRYAVAAGITKRVYPHLFRHQLLTYLTQHGIISPKLQLLSGHTAEQSLAMYRELTLGDVVDEYEAAMRTFPV